MNDHCECFSGDYSPSCNLNSCACELIKYYRLSENSCSEIILLDGNITGMDYETMELCEENIKNNYVIPVSIGIIAFLLSILIVIIIKNRR
jgi:hypothetical protein